jgi:tetratricopeptide (TPR) repeat protein
LEKAPFIILSAGGGLVTYLAARDAGALGIIDYYPLGARLGNSLVSYIWYLGKTFWPAKLAVYYPYHGQTTNWTAVFGSAAALSAISISVLLSLRKRPYLPVGWFWFLSALAPVIGLMQAGAQARADRFVYVPNIGLYLMFSWGIWRIARGNRRRKKYIFYLAAAVLLILSAISRRQVYYWKDSFTLLGRAISLTERNLMAHYNLGVYLSGLGRLAEAERHFNEAVAIKPNAADAYYNLGLVLAAQGRMEQAALRYREALRLKPGFEQAHVNLGVALVELGKTDEAVGHYREAIRLRPDDALAHYNLGLAYLKLGRRREAWESLELAVGADPSLAEGYSKLRYALEKMGGPRSSSSVPGNAP